MVSEGGIRRRRIQVTIIGWVKKMLEMRIRPKKQIYSLYHQLQDAPIGTSIRAILVELGVS
jgi:hypothetical protein